MEREIERVWEKDFDCWNNCYFSFEFLNYFNKFLNISKCYFILDNMMIVIYIMGGHKKRIRDKN